MRRRGGEEEERRSEGFEEKRRRGGEEERVQEAESVTLGDDRPWASTLRPLGQ